MISDVHKCLHNHRCEPIAWLSKLLTYRDHIRICIQDLRLAMK